MTLAEYYGVLMACLPGLSGEELRVIGKLAVRAAKKLEVI